MLPIHRRSYEAYYEAHKKWEEPRRQEVEKDWGKSFDNLPTRVQVQWNEMWFWPPWRFNDIAGFLDIGMDGGTCLTANIYLKRKFFPKSHRERKLRKYSTLENHHILYFGEITKIHVDIGDNHSYLGALEEILKGARKVLNRLNRNFVVWVPNFGFACFDFADAYRQSKRRK